MPANIKDKSPHVLLAILAVVGAGAVGTLRMPAQPAGIVAVATLRLLARLAELKRTQKWHMASSHVSQKGTQSWQEEGLGHLVHARIAHPEAVLACLADTAWR